MTKDTSNETLRDAIARQVVMASEASTTTGNLSAASVLAMPEMQAIRRVLWVLDNDKEHSEKDGVAYTDAYTEWHSILMNMPHVAQWVKSDL